MPRNMLKYSEDEIFWTLRDRAQSIFDKLSDKDKNLLCYLMNPRCTAIGAAFSYNEQTISDFLYNRCTDIAEHTPINGNSDYTLNCVIDGIKAGKY